MQLIPMVVCPQGDRAQTYCELENVLWGDDSCLQCGVVNRLLAELSWDLTADQVRWCSWKAMGAACQAFEGNAEQHRQVFLALGPSRGSPVALRVQAAGEKPAWARRGATAGELLTFLPQGSRGGSRPAPGTAVPKGCCGGVGAISPVPPAHKVHSS